MKDWPRVLYRADGRGGVEARTFADEASIDGAGWVDSPRLAREVREPPRGGEVTQAPFQPDTQEAPKLAPKRVKKGV